MKKEIIAFLLFFFSLPTVYAQTNWCVDAYYRNREWNITTPYGNNKSFSYLKYCPFGCDVNSGECRNDPFLINAGLLVLFIMGIAVIYWFKRKMR